MSNRICSSCGKTYESFGLSSGPAICNECFTEKNPDIPEQEDISNFDFENNANTFNLNSNKPKESNNYSKPKSSYSVNTYISDTFIGLIKFAFAIIVIALMVLAYQLGDLFGGEVGFNIFIFGFIFTIIIFGSFAIFAEIYRSLRGVEQSLNEINNKIKNTNKD
jgi:membrane protein insertase Oxa1/YidC/SpoIIIJ